MNIQYKTQGHIASKMITGNIKNISYQKYTIRKNYLYNFFEGKKKRHNILYL